MCVPAIYHTPPILLFGQVDAISHPVGVLQKYSASSIYIFSWGQLSGIFKLYNMLFHCSLYRESWVTFIYPVLKKFPDRERDFYLFLLMLDQKKRQIGVFQFHATLVSGRLIILPMGIKAHKNGASSSIMTHIWLFPVSGTPAKGKHQPPSKESCMKEMYRHSTPSLVHSKYPLWGHLYFCQNAFLPTLGWEESTIMWVSFWVFLWGWHLDGIWTFYPRDIWTFYPRDYVNVQVCSHSLVTFVSIMTK